MVNKIKIIISLAMILFLSSCGFHMAGKADLDPVFENTHVTYKSGGSRMSELVEGQLKASKNNLVGLEEASAIVTILYERRNRDVLSVDEEGKVREYELILRVGVSVKDAEGKKLINDQNIRLSRDFLFDIDDVLGKGREQNVIYEEMREDIARLIIYRLQAISVDTKEA